jgi:hypothetical protein
MKYSQELKESILQQIAQRGDEPFTHICNKNNIPETTVYTWLRSINKKVGEKQSIDKISHNEKLDLVIDYFSSDEEGKTFILRTQGLFSTDLDLMKEEIILASKDNDETKLKETIKELKEEAKKLKHNLKIKDREIRKNEKVIAETTALLVLKKKLENLLDEDEELFIL